MLEQVPGCLHLLPMLIDNQVGVFYLYHEAELILFTLSIFKQIHFF